MDRDPAEKTSAEWHSKELCERGIAHFENGVEIGSNQNDAAGVIG